MVAASFTARRSFSRVSYAWGTLSEKVRSIVSVTGIWYPFWALLYGVLSYQAMLWIPTTSGMAHTVGSVGVMASIATTWLFCLETIRTLMKYWRTH